MPPAPTAAPAAAPIVLAPSGRRRYPVGIAEDDDSDGPTRPTEWFEDGGSLRSRIVDGVSRLSRGAVESTFRSRAHAGDGELNAMCRPGADQSFETLTLWATEAYAPAQIVGLLSGLERFGRRARGLSNRNPADWVRRQRRHPGSGFELYLSRPAPRFAPIGFGLDLPSFCRAATGTIWTATPSLTMITIAFELHEVERARIGSTLHAEHATSIVAEGPRFSVRDPASERSRLIAETRAAWIGEASA